MSAKERKGYDWPTNPLPTDDRCLFVFIPDDDMYLRHFMGSLDYFSTWIAWRRDDDKTGALIADRWRDSVQRTRDCMSFCDDMLLKMDDIVAAISASSVNVSVNSICCDDIVPPVQQPPADPVDWPVSDGDGGGVYPTPQEYNDAVCEAISGVLWLFRRYAGSLITINTVALGAAAIVSLIAALIPEPLSTAIGTISFVAIASTLVAATVYSQSLEAGASQFVTWIDANKETVACTAKGAASSLETWIEELTNALQQELNTKLTDAGVPSSIASPVSTLFFDAAEFALGVIDALLVPLGNLEQPPASWLVDCACLGPTAFYEPFASDDCSGPLWICDRVDMFEDAPTDYYAEFNARDISSAALYANGTGWVAEGNGTGSIANATLELRWKRIEGTTGDFRVWLVDDSTGSQSLVYQPDIAAPALDVWQQASIAVPFTIRVGVVPNPNQVISITLTTGTARCRLGIDDIRIRGTIT